jgi:hypothetical protein
MTATASGAPDGDPPREATGGETTGGTATDDADRAYFEAIEETFIRLRGAPLLLSPADWRVASRWRRRGVPLELVRHTLEELFERRRERGARGRIQSLRYCANAVEAAFEELSALQAPGERHPAPPLDVGARLTALAAALPPGLPGGERAAERIAALGGDPEAVENALAAIDRELLEAADEALGDEGRRQLEERALAGLGALADRLPAAELEAARGRLARRLLRRDLGLPVLSLVAPEAEAGDPGTG